MKKGKQQTPKDTSGPITSANYAFRATAHCRMKYGLADDGRWPVLIKKERPGSWTAWIMYFDRIGYRASVRMMRDPSTQSWGVPELHPAQFDPAQASDLVYGRE
jgi:hypothetical protein